MQSQPNANEERKLKRKMRKKFLRQKKARIVIRNLSFKANEDVIRDKFRTYGSIVDISIPTKTDGHMKGCAFVGFDTIKACLKAIKDMNGKQLLGRTVAIDFALPKKAFQNISETTDDQTVKNEESDTKDKDGDYDEMNEELEQSQENVVKSEDEDMIDKNNGKNDDLNNSDADEDEDYEENDEIDGDDSEDEDEKSTKKQRHRDIKQLSDASEERTVFVRNLPFSSTTEMLTDLMSKFGQMDYCKLCVDQVTEHPKGSAFVKFRNKTDAEKCLAEANDSKYNSYFTLDGRNLIVTLALTKNKLNEVYENRFKKDRDKRNLFLAREGLIYPGSPAADGVSQSDLSKRLSLETRKRKMLQNNHFFVSQTRLCVHNLPPDYDNAKLKKLFQDAVNEKNAAIVEARVMRNRNKVNKAFGKSKGFGFVEFKEHSYALKALRELNNNPSIFTAQKRPIVEFSIENRVALNIKQKRLNPKNKKKHNDNIGSTNMRTNDNNDGQDYSGIISKPNRKGEKIMTPKVNRKLGEMRKKLKIRGKVMNKQKVVKERAINKNRKQKSHSKSVKQEIKQIDMEDRHFNKKKRLFIENHNNNNNNNNNSRGISKQKRAKWYQ